MRFGEAGGVAAWGLADQVVDVTLPVQRGLQAAVAGYGCEAHAFEQGMELVRFRVGEFHEFEAVRAGRILLADRGARSVMWKRTHAVAAF